MKASEIIILRRQVKEMNLNQVARSGHGWLRLFEHQDEPKVTIDLGLSSTYSQIFDEFEHAFYFLMGVRLVLDHLGYEQSVRSVKCSEQVREQWRKDDHRAAQA